MSDDIVLPPPVICGGVSAPNSANDLDGDAAAANEFAKANVPGL